MDYFVGDLQDKYFLNKFITLAVFMLPCMLGGFYKYNELKD